MHLGETLSTLSALTILLSGIALVTGVVLIRRQQRRAHQWAMLTASALAVVFLVFYLTRMYIGYEKTYVGPDAWRLPYLALLVSHIVLAAANMPLVLMALLNAMRGLRAAGGDVQRAEPAHFARHRAWVRWAVPVWLYVAVTGWVIYLVLGRWGEVIV